MLKLYITEKPNAAKDLATALGDFEKNSDGFYHMEMRPDEEVVIGYAAGHFVGLKEPADLDIKYKKWELADLPITYDGKDYLKIIDGKENGFNKLKKYIQKADIVVNAGDAGREGELIQRWIIKMAGGHNKIYRLWASSLTVDALIKANEEMKPNSVYDNLYASGEARAIMDAFLGFNYSRAISLIKTDGVTVSYGRCQTPLLKAIVDRDKEVENFMPEFFSFLKTSFQYQDEIFTGEMIDEKHKRIEFRDEAKALAVLSELKADVAIVDKVEIKEKVNRPPRPYDLLNLQKEMAKRFGYDADFTLEICQDLYDKHKILSYPRTDGEYLTTDLKDKIKDHLQVINFGRFSNLVSGAGSGVPERYFNNAKISDHHAVIPVINKDMERIYYSLTEPEKNVFDFVCLRFISLFYPDHIYEQVRLISLIEDKRFLSKGRCDKQAGWQEVYKGVAGDKEEDDERETALPVVQKGSTLQVMKTEIINGKTKPKKRFTTDSLLTLMKMYGIGTGATRANLIKELTLPKGKNKQVYVEKKKNSYISTIFGRDVIELIPEELKSLNLLSALDDKLRQIEAGQLSKDVFLKALTDELKTQLEKMKTDKEVKIVAERPEQKLSKLICPRCGLSLVAYKSGWGCIGYKHQSCSFYIGNKYGQKKLSEKVIKQLIENGRSDTIKGFTSKAGKKFDARLIYVDERIKFDFAKK